MDADGVEQFFEEAARHAARVVRTVFQLRHSFGLMHFAQSSEELLELVLYFRVADCDLAQFELPRQHAVQRACWVL